MISSSISHNAGSIVHESACVIWAIMLKIDAEKENKLNYYKGS